jgi:iron(III) transport system substrate-binding protein
MTDRHTVYASRAAVLVGLAALVLPACGGDDGPTLNVYSGRHYGIETAFAEYEEQTGVNVEFLTGNDAELRERIAAEGDETQADVYLTVDAGNLWRAGEDDLFQPIDSAVLAGAIPAELKDPQNRWFGLAVRARTIVYNTDLVDAADVPDTYEALAQPEYRGRICLRNANNDYQQSLVASMIAADGPDSTLEVLEGWAANAEIFANDVALLEAMAAGACEIGIANHYYLARLLEETLGQEFLEWLATDGQDTLVADNHEYPANPDVAPEPLIAEQFGNDFVRDQLAADVLGSFNADAVRLMDEADFG